MKRLLGLLACMLAACMCLCAAAEESNPFAGRWAEEDELGAAFTFYADGSCAGTMLFCDVQGAYTVCGSVMTLQVSASPLAGLEELLGTDVAGAVEQRLDSAVFVLQDADTLAGAGLTLHRDSSWRELKAVADGKLEGLWENRDASGDPSALALYFGENGVMYALENGLMIEKAYQRHGSRIDMGDGDSVLSAYLQQDGTLQVQHAGVYVKTQAYQAPDFASVAGFYLSGEEDGVYSGCYLTQDGKLLRLSFDVNGQASWSVREDALTMAGDCIGAHDEWGNRYFARIGQGVMTEETWTGGTGRSWERSGIVTSTLTFTADEIEALLGLEHASSHVPAEMSGTWVAEGDGRGYVVIYPDGTGYWNAEQVRVQTAGDRVFLHAGTQDNGRILALTLGEGRLLYRTQAQATAYVHRAAASAPTAAQETGAAQFALEVTAQGVVIRGLRSGDGADLTALTIPRSIFGLPVTEIGPGAFSGCRALTTLDLGEGLVRIGSDAFADCRALAALSIPSTVREIGDRAFQNTHALTQVHIPSGVTTIGDYAFAQSGLLQLTLEKGVRHIGSCAFSGCGITALELPEGLTFLGTGAFADCGSLREVVIGEGLTAIGANTFAGSSDPTIRLPMSLETLSPAFADNARPVLIVYEDSAAEELAQTCWSQVQRYEVIAYGSGAAAKEEDFTYYVQQDGTAWITAWKGNDAELVIPASLGGSPVTVIGEKVFRRNGTLTLVVIPEGVRLIKEEAFSSCSALATVSLPSTLRSIEREAFYYCTSLAQIGLPQGLQTIGGNAFLKCPLTAAELPESLVSIGDGAFRMTNLTSVSFPAGLQEIGKQAFADTDIRSLVIPSTLQKIGAYAFERCTWLTSVTLPEDMTVMPEGLLSNTTALRSIVLPGGLTAIPLDAFAGSGLTEITIPAPVRSIGNRAFSSCRNLKSIVFEGAPATIGGWAFTSCPALTEAELPQGVEQIGPSAFSNCPELMTLALPDSVWSIGDNLLYASGKAVLEASDGSYACQ